MCQDEAGTKQYHGEPVSTVDGTYVEPSTTRILKHNEKLNRIYSLNITRPFFAQRLSNRSYFFGGGFYTTTFYVGDKGVLVFDPPENQGSNLLEAISSITDLPVTAIAYSHCHADHLIATSDLLKAAENAGVATVRIIASTATAEKMKLLNGKLPAPTELLQWPKDQFSFEDLTVDFGGFVKFAHCDDAAYYLLVEEKVIHLVDLINGDQPPFVRFGTASQCLYYRDNANEAGALDWVHLVGGHGNVGSKEDIKFVNKYIDDLERAVGSSMAQIKFAANDLDKHVDHAALMLPWMAEVCKAATDKMRPEYGKYYGFERSLPTNAELKLLDLVSYRG